MTAIATPRHSWWAGPAAAIAVLALGVAFADSMPDPIATHWGLSGRPDGSMPLWWGLSIAPLVAGIGVFVSTGREQTQRRRGMIGAIGLGLVLQLVVIYGNAGASRWTEARSIPLWSVLLLVGVALAAAWYVERHRTPIPPALLVPPALREAFPPGRRAVWSSSATNRWLLLLAVGVVLGCLVGQLYVPALIASAGLFGTSLRVTAGANGVAVSGAVPLGRKRYPLDTIASAAVGEHRSLSYGYRGGRKVFGHAVWAVRRGATLVLHLTDGTSLAITVDDAAAGVDLINGLLGMESAASR